MRLDLVVLTATVMLSFPALADETVMTTDGRQILLRSDGTYEETRKPNETVSIYYRNISIEDLKRDIHRLDGQNIEVKAKLLSLGGAVVLGDPKSFLDSKPILADASQLSENDRQQIRRCDTGCNITIRGKVGRVMSHAGVILHSVQK